MRERERESVCVCVCEENKANRSEIWVADKTKGQRKQQLKLQDP